MIYFLKEDEAEEVPKVPDFNNTGPGCLSFSE